MYHSIKEITEENNVKIKITSSSEGWCNSLELHKLRIDLLFGFFQHFNQVLRLTCICDCEERVRRSTLWCSCRAPNTMNVILRRVGIVKVYDVLYIVDICSTTNVTPVTRSSHEQPHNWTFSNVTRFTKYMQFLEWNKLVWHTTILYIKK